MIIISPTMAYPTNNKRFLGYILAVPTLIKEWQDFFNTSPAAVFATLHFLRYLRIGPVS